MTPEKLDDVMRRALQFQMMELPGQWPMMHMGTLYLVNDLARAVSELRADRTPDPAQIRADAIREAMETIMPLAILSSYDRKRIKAAIRALLATPLSPTAVDNSPAPDAGGKDDPAVYLICKYGGYYRPNCQGYTRFKEDAGRYTLAEAIRESHPNGPDGPRDGMTYIHEDDVGPFDAGGKEEAQ